MVAMVHHLLLLLTVPGLCEFLVFNRLMIQLYPQIWRLSKRWGWTACRIMPKRRTRANIMIFGLIPIWYNNKFVCVHFVSVATRQLFPIWYNRKGYSNHYTPVATRQLIPIWYNSIRPVSLHNAVATRQLIPIWYNLV